MDPRPDAVLALVKALEDARQELVLERTQRDELLHIEQQRMVVLQRMLGAAGTKAFAGHRCRAITQAALHSWRRALRLQSHPLDRSRSLERLCR